MKNILIQFILTAIITWLAQLFLPWWSLVIIAGIIALFFTHKYGATSFFVGFLSVGLVWFLAAFMATNGVDNQILPAKMGELFGGLSRMSLILTTAAIGGIMGGFGALTGSLGKKLME